MALSRLCRLAGEEDKAAEYARKAAELEAKIKNSLWNADGTFDVKPLAPREWEWFSLKNLRHCGHVVDIDYRRGRGLVVKVDGKTVLAR
jgi:hypothetical protein